MRTFTDKIAVITGGGSGIGRELACQLAAAGCNVAMCDLLSDAMAETKQLCEAGRPNANVRISTHRADVSDEANVLRFRDEIEAQQATDRIHLLFNNAGIGGGGSMIADSRERWERTFNISWGGVHLCTRAFLPMLVKAEEGHIVNMSSVSGFWAYLGPSVPYTSQSAAKFAVKGFTEALITDLRLNAPHVGCSVAMPGHVGTPMTVNSRKIQSGSALLSGTELAQVRERFKARGLDLSDEQIQKTIAERDRQFQTSAPTTAAAAATTILDGVKAGEWRILVGEDTKRIDKMVRERPERAYDLEFYETVVKEVGWRLGG
jgi:NAD(P)-dependent dehydrogenase (short-subunit alcohol dehydrogenase family)